MRFNPKTQRNERVLMEEVGHHESGNLNLLDKAYGKFLDVRLEKATFDFTHTLQSASAGKEIKKVYLSAFGFSRGAAAARAFMHWLKNIPGMSVADKKLKYNVPENNIKNCEVEVLFLGLFDTVESIGEVGANNQRDTYPQTIPDYVKECTHLIAGHELRPAFPVTSIGAYSGKLNTYVYPGAHANLGGGYSDGEQGKNKDLCKIMNLKMLNHAWGANLPIASKAELQKDKDQWNTVFIHNFNPAQRSNELFDEYLAKVPTGNGIVRDIAAHLRMYWEYMDSGQKAQYIDQQHPSFIDQIKPPQKLSDLQMEQQRRAPRNPLIASIQLKGPFTLEIAEFFNTMVHDSFEHFVVPAMQTQQIDGSQPNYYAMRRIVNP